LSNRSTAGGARTHSALATTFTLLQNKIKRLSSLRCGDSQAARRVGGAPVNRGETVPTQQACTHINAESDTGTDVKHAWWRFRGGPTHRRRCTHTVSARDQIRPDATAAHAHHRRWPCTHHRQRRHPPRRHSSRRNPKANTLRRDGWTHELLAVFPEPPPTVAALRPRTQACTHAHRQTQTSVPTSTLNLTQHNSQQ
jgi:hypothetical protein